LAGYQAIGKQVATHTGVQLPGAAGQRSPVGSPSMERRESDYDDFWAENGIKDASATAKKAEPAKFAGQQTPATRSTVAKGNDKEDEWENW
jgi:hypothetical protein